ncbi:LOW QUALITY PROTEIN: U3 small nucleolar RNA-associated protein 14 homolog A-like [Lingula anatina]|uniref:LOW QUALITY PROTEIN: U3 small nucleolar RNA-associated protein 14 homolog A-like n=1 Tax=Lingula anatina TaxID=7574 RepID=A0A1S3J0L6_LINAN|nr:LOW QUALITY PROTEIN: U3 small nucleolar RNA-associated protein 14 homolog A-like [Lingula anatina]|eukprot:XP_013403803.1 LOW QUALITY PROTEIN: U3 small nucleolar RNA-associated protein 14 homolog A-like [Lingula anatina]
MDSEDNVEISASEEEGDDEEKHARLLDAVSSLSGGKSKVLQRSEASLTVSEFSIGTSKDSEKVKLHDLVGSLRNTTKHGDLKKQLNTVNKRNKVLQQPLPKPEQERIQRTVAYEDASKEVAKWDPVVEKNRRADQLKFPLQQPNLRLHTTDQFVKRFQIMDSEDNVEISASEEEGDDEEKHARLLDAVSSLSGGKSKVLQRSGASLTVSEFSIGTSKDSEKVKLHDLVGSLRNTTKHGDLKKQLNTVNKRNKVLQQPLPKPEQERIQRTVAYEDASKEVAKWDPVVEKNRKADQLKFPLQQPNLRLHTTDQFVKRFQPRTPLEKEIATLLHGSQNVMMQEKALTAAEEKALKAMSLEEAKTRRAELQKYRALLSYKEAKSRRQNKIKSKRYHRIKKKEKMKEEKKALEELQKTDPEAYLEKLQMLDKQRMQERMSLKHKGGSKYMRNVVLYGKHNDHSRQAVQDMLQKNKELTNKPAISSESDGSDTEEPMNGNTRAMSDKSSANPWMTMLPKHHSVYKKPDAVVNLEAQVLIQDEKGKDSDDSNDEKEIQQPTKELEAGKKKEDIDDDVECEEEDDESENEKLDELFDVLERKKQEQLLKSSKRPKEKKSNTNEPSVKKPEKNAKKRTQEKQRPVKDDTSGSDSEGNEEEEEEEEKDGGENSDLDYEMEDSGDELITQVLKRKRKYEDFERNMSDDDDDNLKTLKKESKKHKVKDNEQSSSAEGEIQVDPKKIVTVGSKSVCPSQIPNIVGNEEDEEDPVETQRMTIAQAFASDDVVEEFNMEKTRLEERDKPKDIDLTLPGWGDWGGTGLKVSRKKKKRFLIKAPPLPPRKDKDKQNVIISETKDNSIAKHQVNDLPFPFSNIKQFESAIRAPIGKTWNPETAYRKMIRPKVLTKLGTVIEPMDKSEVFKKQQMKGGGKGLPVAQKKEKTRGSKQSKKRKQKT